MRNQKYFLSSYTYPKKSQNSINGGDDINVVSTPLVKLSSKGSCKIICPICIGQFLSHMAVYLYS